jgi:hypothetical protein
MDFSISFVDLSGAPKSFLGGGEFLSGGRVADWYFSPNGPWGTGPQVDFGRVFVAVRKSAVDIAILAVFDDRAYWEQGRIEGSFQSRAKTNKISGDVASYHRYYQSTYSDGAPILERVPSHLAIGEYSYTYPAGTILRNGQVKGTGVNDIVTHYFAIPEVKWQKYFSGNFSLDVLKKANGGSVPVYSGEPRYGYEIPLDDPITGL